MYFQDILQGIALNLMGSNLFELKSSTHTGGCWSLGDFYQHIFKHLWDKQFNTGHWSFAYRISSMALGKYTTDRTRKAIAEVIELRDKIYRSSGTLVGAKFTKASERLQYLLLLLRYRGVDTWRL